MRSGFGRMSYGLRGSEYPCCCRVNLTYSLIISLGLGRAPMMTKYPGAQKSFDRLSRLIRGKFSNINFEVCWRKIRMKCAGGVVG